MNHMSHAPQETGHVPQERQDEARAAAAMTIQRLFRCRHARIHFRKLLGSVFDKYYDEESGMCYYHNKRTGETTWERPKVIKRDDYLAVAGVHEPSGHTETTSPTTVDNPGVATLSSNKQRRDGEEQAKDGEEDTDDDDKDAEEEDEEGASSLDEDRDAMGYTEKERALVRQQFDNYDTDRSGSINAKELLKLMLSLGEQMNLKNVEELIRQVDANSNGEVEFEEFLMILRRQKDRNQYSASLELAILFGPKELENLKRQFIKLDLDGSGFIDEHEIQALIRKLGRKVEEYDLKAMLMEVDADGSGSIGFNEFLQIVASMMKEENGGKRSGFAALLDLGIAQGVLNELNDVMAASKTAIYEWWNADLIAEQKRLEAKRERRRKQEEERRKQVEKDKAAYEELQTKLAAEEAARRAKVDGLQLETLFAGDGLNYPTVGQYVRVHYTGMFHQNGIVFESTRKRGGALEFCVGAGHLIKGFDLALQRMSVGETAKVSIAPMLAYGVKGRPPKIPPNASLIFKIELISIKEKLVALDMSPEDDD